jgi:hypothetical protein
VDDSRLPSVEDANLALAQARAAKAHARADGERPPFGDPAIVVLEALAEAARLAAVDPDSSSN